MQQPIAAKLNSNLIGKIVDVLLEQRNPGTDQMVGRCWRFAPEVDGEVHLSCTSSNGLVVKPGMLLPVLITGADLYDLTGEFVGVEEIVDKVRSK